MKSLARQAVATAVATYLLMVLGSLVSAMDAGLACPDWPLCHGRLLPPWDPKVLLEWNHRFVAALVGIMILILAIRTWRALSDRPAVRAAALLAVVLLPFQVVLGGLTVLHGLPPLVTTLHLAFATAIFTSLLLASLWLVRLQGGRGTDQNNWAPSAERLRRPLAITLAATLGQMLLGGFVSAAGAGLGCGIEWPLCHGGWFPTGHSIVWIHYAHRLLAGILGGLVIFTLIRGAGVAREQPAERRRPFYRCLWLIGALFTVQVVLGALAVLTVLHPLAVTAHLAAGLGVWGGLVLLLGVAAPVPASRWALRPGEVSAG